LPVGIAPRLGQLLQDLLRDNKLVGPLPPSIDERRRHPAPCGKAGDQHISIQDRNDHAEPAASLVVRWRWRSRAAATEGSTSRAISSGGTSEGLAHAIDDREALVALPLELGEALEIVRAFTRVNREL
jgi:hypothetical protein